MNDNNPYYFAQDGVLFERIPAQNSLSDEYEEQFALVRYPTGKTDESYTVPAFVRSIDYRAFAGNTSKPQGNYQKPASNGGGYSAPVSTTSSMDDFPKYIT